MKVLSAPFATRHYAALVNMARLYPDFVDCLNRYLFSSGVYPANVKVRIPGGILAPTLYSPDDMLTLNEVFCREDYRLPKGARVVVDVGANIGLSALYFLTRNPELFCYLFEPVPQNVDRLKRNLRDFPGRFQLSEMAVDVKSGQSQFGVESTGRYGGLLKSFEKSIRVDCVEINTALSEAISTYGRIDLLKIDTEGTEIKLIQKIESDILKVIKTIVFEGCPSASVLAEGWHQSQRGSICRIVRR